MAAFIKRSNGLMDQCRRHECNRYQAAASISYDFVSIHPFPDYNGRVSRVIMNMVLLALHCPFPVSLKGTKKERHRYFLSLRKANNGNLDFLSSLIAKSVVETFQELDRHLEKSDLPTLLK
jgi:Fic family protein